MEPEEEYRRKERMALLVIVVLASLSVASLLVAFSYYCYVRNKVAKRLQNLKGENTTLCLFAQKMHESERKKPEISSF